MWAGLAPPEAVRDCPILSPSFRWLLAILGFFDLWEHRLYLSLPHHMTLSPSMSNCPLLIRAPVIRAPS